MKKERQGKSGVFVFVCLVLVLTIVGCESAQINKDSRQARKSEETQSRSTASVTDLITTEEKPEVFVQLGHSWTITSVAFSPDGKYALSGSEDKTIRLWDVASGKEIRIFQGHSSGVESVAFSPDGKYALSGSGDNSIKLWEISSGREIRSFTGHSDKVRSVSFSPDGKYALSGSFDKSLKLWDLSSGREIRSFAEQLSITSSAFSPDGKYILSVCHNWFSQGTLKLWEVSSGREIRSFSGHLQGVFSIAYSSDGKYALGGSLDKTLKLWEVSSGREIRSFIGHSDSVYSVAYSPDGKYALSGGVDKTLKLWEVSSGREIRSFSGHSDYVRSVAFSPDGKYALSGSRDRTIKLWEVSSGREIRSSTGYSEGVLSVSFSPDGKYALYGNTGKTMNLWEIPSGREVQSFIGHSDSVKPVAFSPDGKYALSGSYDKTLKLWEVSSGKEIRSFTGHSDYVFSVAFSPDGKYALSGSYDKTLKLWEISSGKEIRSFTGHSDYVFSVAFSPDSKYALSGSVDRKLKLWEVSSGKEIRSFIGHSDVVISVIFSKDGKYALSGSYDKTLKLWEVSSGREIRSFIGHSDCVSSVAFSSNGRYALSGSHDYTMKLWDVETGKEIQTFSGHSPLGPTAFSPDGNYILSGSVDSTRHLWKISTGKEIAQMVSFKDGEWLAITPEGYYNASVHGDKYLNVRIGNNVYGIDQYKAKYYRPDIVQLALKLGDTQQAIAQLKGDTEGLKASEQPPKVWFVSPSDRYETDKPFIEVQVKTEDIADTAESVTFKVNQRILATEKKPVRPVSEGAKVREFSRQVPLIPGENFIEAEARGKAGATQKTMILVIRKGGEKKLPALWYFGAGVSQHSISPLSLKYSAKDVTGLADALKHQKGRAYSEVNIRTLTDAEATRGNIMDSIESFFAGAKQEDIAILFVSGHGMNSASGYYFIAHDTNPDRMSSTGVSGEFFNNVLKTVIRCRVLLFADTCHSGNITGNENWKNQANADTNEFLRGADNNGVIVFASSSGTSVSREDPSWGHGAFAKALIDGIMGEAAYRENVVKLSFLQDYVKSSVMKLTENTQQPVIPKLAGGGEFLELVLAKKM